MKYFTFTIQRLGRASLGHDAWAYLAHFGPVAESAWEGCDKPKS